MLTDQQMLLAPVTHTLRCMAPRAPEQPVLNEAIVLGRLPEIMIAGEFATYGRIIEDTLPIAHRAQAGPGVIPDECFLLLRYGVGTWGHWIGEILPTAVVVETFLPKRFRYAVPYVASAAYRKAMEESLAYYGIMGERLLWLDLSRMTRFTNAWAVTPIWTNRTPHPHAMALMRPSELRNLQQERRIALLRTESKTRKIVNVDEVQGLLRERGFEPVEPCSMGVADQIRMFAGMANVVSVLGSSLAGLVWAPPGISVLALAPDGWGDDYFYNMARVRHAWSWAEVRGPSEWDGKTGQLRDAAFEVPLDRLERELPTGRELPTEC